MELFTTADGIMDVFIKAIDKLEKLKVKKSGVIDKCTESINDLKVKRSAADDELLRANKYIAGIEDLMAGGSK